MLDSTKPGMPYIEEQVTLQDDLYNLFLKKNMYLLREKTTKYYLLRCKGAYLYLAGWA